MACARANNIYAATALATGKRIIDTREQESNDGIVVGAHALFQASLPG
jgi:hypothetical protein